MDVLRNFIIVIVAAGFTSTALAGNDVLPQWVATKAAYQPRPTTNAPTTTARAGDSTDAKTLILTAAPGDVVSQQRIYAPVAAQLSAALGRTVQFKPATNWLTYSRDMTAGTYDLVLDDAHFNAWRAEHIQHVPVLSLGDHASFAVVVRADDTRVPTLERLTGRRLCTVGTPNLGALAVLAQFSNPMRQPTVVEAADANAAYDAFKDGKCAAAVVTESLLEAHHDELRVIYRTPAFPGAALSAGPRIDAAMRGKIVEALTSAAGINATKALRAYYSETVLAPAQPQQYAGMSRWLKDSLYYQ